MSGIGPLRVNKYESFYEKNSKHLLTHDFMTTFLFSKTISTAKESNIKLISNYLLTVQNRVCEYHQVLRISVQLHSRLNIIQHVDFLWNPEKRDDHWYIVLTRKMINFRKMIKYTQTICRLLPTNCLKVFDHFVELTLKGLKCYLNLSTCYNIGKNSFFKNNSKTWLF